MMAARKLDGEDPNIVFMLRCIYGGVQAIAVLVALFIYMKASAAASDTGNAVKIYVPPPPQVSSVYWLVFFIINFVVGIYVYVPIRDDHSNNNIISYNIWSSPFCYDYF